MHTKTLWQGWFQNAFQSQYTWYKINVLDQCIPLCGVMVIDFLWSQHTMQWMQLNVYLTNCCENKHFGYSQVTNSVTSTFHVILIYVTSKLYYYYYLLGHIEKTSSNSLTVFIYLTEKLNNWVADVSWENKRK